MCKYDTSEGGTCSDKACKSNHVSGYRFDGNFPLRSQNQPLTPLHYSHSSSGHTESDIASYVLATSGLGTGEKREVFARGLTLALDRLPRPLTLDQARRAAFLFWTESHPADSVVVAPS